MHTPLLLVTLVAAPILLTACIKEVAVHPCTVDPGSSACVTICASVMASSSARAPGSPAVGK